ncbi:MAG: hypothetical protein EPO00_01385 [Chloroflexota bacterium]|nr:MAG: hypothetical protein EPO00_01385 [Chloroflexota bacterium]
MRRLVLTLALASIALAACGGGSAASPPASAATAPPASGAAGAPQILPIFVSSEILAGKNRFLFSLTDRANNVVAAPDVPVALEWYDVAAAPDQVAFTSDARFLWAIEGQKGLYAADVEFPTAGRWGVRFTASFPDGRSEQVRADFDVAAAGSTPAIGAPAISVDTPTAADVGGDLAKVSTDTAPNPAFYQTSVADALSAKEPFVLVFATPAFCQTAICGPMLDNVKAVAADYPTLTFINVEPYKMVFADGRLQPELADGQLQAAVWTDAWGLRTEPWIFVVDGSGKVTAKFEGAVAKDELTAAFDAVAPSTGRATGIVIAVDQPSITQVNSFTLRTDAGAELVFGVGPLDLTDGGFNAGHLREHMTTGTAINVAFEVAESRPIATKLTDAN